MHRARANNAAPARPPAVSAGSKATSKTTTTTADGTSVTRRLQQELMSLMMNGDKSISAFPESDNIMRWRGTVNAPSDTVFEGLDFKLSLEFPPNYPFAAPNVRFETPCFHPNVSETGEICLDILKEKWSALYDARTILLSIQSLLSEPNNASPLNGQAARMWDDPVRYREHARRFHSNGCI